jgi:hypothetical protein
LEKFKTNSDKMIAELNERREKIKIEIQENQKIQKKLQLQKVRIFKTSRIQKKEVKN